MLCNVGPYHEVTDLASVCVLCSARSMPWWVYSGHVIWTCEILLAIWEPCVKTIWAFIVFFPPSFLSKHRLCMCVVYWDTRFNCMGEWGGRFEMQWSVDFTATVRLIQPLLFNSHERLFLWRLVFTWCGGAGVASPWNIEILNPSTVPPNVLKMSNNLIRRCSSQDNEKGGLLSATANPARPKPARPKTAQLGLKQLSSV